MDKRAHAERMAHDATYVPTVPGWEYSVANLSRVLVVAAALVALPANVWALPPRRVVN